MKTNTGQVEPELTGQVKPEKGGQVDVELTSQVEPEFGGQVKTDCLVNAMRKRVVNSMGFSINQYYSENGAAFKEIHLIIMNFKSWLRGIHHKCKYGYLQKYLDEFFFRFNRSNSEKSIFNKIINRFVRESPVPLTTIYELNT
jgi:hypothetical protein